MDEVHPISDFGFGNSIRPKSGTRRPSADEASDLQDEIQNPKSKIQNTKPLREQALEQIKRVKWHPSWGEGRMANMFKAPSGLVRLAAAFVGSSDPGFLLPGMR